MFSCTICANNELPRAEARASIGAIRIAAEMQTPSQTVPLDLSPADEKTSGPGAGLEPGETRQKIVRFDLKEQGNHVLAITVTYTETSRSTHEGSTAGEQASGGRVRTFRKLYQFAAEPCLAVRTKTVELPATIRTGPGQKPGNGPTFSRYLLEAQLENLSHDPMTVEVCHRVPWSWPELRSSADLDQDGPADP